MLIVVGAVYHACHGPPADEDEVRLALLAGYVGTGVLAAGTGLNLYSSFVRTRCRKRRKDGLCPTCGYDLRASKNRCPECGSPIPSDAEKARA
jgi:tRNA(Ile2) C34 agmatinyltransferase TiaS